MTAVVLQIVPQANTIKIPNAYHANLAMSVKGELVYCAMISVFYMRVNA